MIVGLFPELCGSGGIQRSGRHICAVIATLAQELNFQYQFLSLNDPPGGHRARVGTLVFDFTGFDRAKIKFVSSVFLSPYRKLKLVLAAHPNLAPVAGLARCMTQDGHSLVFAHGIEVWEPLPVWRRCALRRSDWVVAPSAYTIEKLVGIQGISRAKIRLLPWGLDPEFLAGASRPVGTPVCGFPDGLVILAVARLASSERYKGVDLLIRAMPPLCAENPDACLVIVGDGDDRARLENLAARSEARDAIYFLGALEQEPLLECYRRCAIFAMPSHGEGFGLVYLEAMAMGKPVIAGDHGGAPEVVQDGVSGFLVRSGDLEALTDRVLRLLQDEPLRKRMGEAGRRRVEENFTFARFHERLTEILKSAV